MVSSSGACSEKKSSRDGLKKGPWSTDEDQILISHITTYGHANWRALPKLAGLARCGKSCRLRWTNYLRPEIKRGNFTKLEEDTIIHLHQQLGNKWSAIAAKLPGRTDNEIKNMWHAQFKKRLPADHAAAASATLRYNNNDRHQQPPQKRRRSKAAATAAASSFHIEAPAADAEASPLAISNDRDWSTSAAAAATSSSLSARWTEDADGNDELVAIEHDYSMVGDDGRSTWKGFEDQADEFWSAMMMVESDGAGCSTDGHDDSDRWPVS